MEEVPLLEDLSFKILDGPVSPFVGFRWPEVGTWTRRIGVRHHPLELCERGYHLTDAYHIPNWFNNIYHHLYLAEWRGARKTGRDKFCVQEARLVKELAMFPCESLENAFCLTYFGLQQSTTRDRLVTWMNEHGVPCR